MLSGFIDLFLTVCELTSKMAVCMHVIFSGSPIVENPGKTCLKLS